MATNFVCLISVKYSKLINMEKHFQNFSDIKKMGKFKLLKSTLNHFLINRRTENAEWCLSVFPNAFNFLKTHLNFF
jgi:hypothetical protein